MMSILAECPVCHKKHSIRNKKCACGANLDKEKKNGKVKYHIVYRDKGKQKWRGVGAFKDLDGYSLDDARAADARLVVAKRQNEIEIFDPKPEAKMTFNDLANWYLNLERVKGLASYPTITIYMKKFNQVFGNIQINTIKTVDLENHQEKRKREGLKPKTIDDEINYVQTMIVKAFDNDMIDGQALKAFRRVKRLLSGKKRGTNTRSRTLTFQEIEAIAEACKEKHTVDKLLFGYWTGMRAGEIMKLRWRMIDLPNRMITLPGEVTKEGKEKKIPIGKLPHEILRRDNQHIREAGPDDYAFTYWGKPITRQFTTGFKTASKKAGVPWGREVENGWIFHDLRRTFKTDMRKAGVHKSVIDAIVGHSGNDMDSRYNIIDDNDRLEAVRQLEAYRESVRQNVRQVEKTENGETLKASNINESNK